MRPREPMPEQKSLGGSLRIIKNPVVGEKKKKKVHLQYSPLGPAVAQNYIWQCQKTKQL